MRQLSSSYINKPSTHRIRIEEKKLTKKLVKTLVFFIVAIFAAIYIGLPIFVKIIVAISSFKNDKSETQLTQSSPVFPPVLDVGIEATNSTKINISGFGEKESTVKILVNNQEQAKVLVDKEGRFLAKNISLSEGTNVVTAQTIIKDKESDLSSPVNIIYKKNPPKLVIDSPTDGQKFASDEKEIDISGETDPGGKITVNDRFVIVNQNGKFNYSVSLNDGENTFKIIATDEAGNQTMLEIKAYYEL